MSRRMQEVRGWLMASPYLLFATVFFFVPLLWSVVLMFSDWNLISPERQWVGLQNFVEALQSRRVHQAFLSSFRFMILIIPLGITVSLAIALLVNSLKRFQGLFAVGFFLPYLASGVAVSLVVRGILAFNSPVGRFFLNTFGSVPDWLGHPTLAILIISLMIVWKFSGYYALIFLAGLQSIPQELYEAAQMDGASSWRAFWSITLPMLYPALYSVLILMVGLMFSIFTEPYVLTKGGPNLATHTWYLEIYYQAFSTLRSGYATAISTLNALAVFVMVTIVRRGMERWGRSLGWV